MATCQVTIKNPHKVFTPVFTRLWNAHERFLVNYGGTGSSKSFSAAQKEVLISCQKKVTTLVIRKVNATLKTSVIASFRRRITEFGLTPHYKYNKVEQTLENKVTGSMFIFRGLDDPEKLKSIEGINRIFIEEASELEMEDFFELNRRVRGVPNIQIVINFNPIHEQHWLKEYFFDSDLPNTRIVHSTYKDNPFLSDEDREQIEWLKTFNYNQYRIYALGEWGITENKDPWLFSLNEDVHIVPDLPFLFSYPIYLSFDFNRSPVTCSVTQMSPSKGMSDSFLHVIDEFHGDIQLEDLCQKIKVKYPQSIMYVTGDASGNQGDIAFEGRHSTYYTMIKRYLSLNDKQMNINSRNLEHNDSRMLCNMMLTKYPNFKISQKGCPMLIDDCRKATVDDKSIKPGVLKKDRSMYKMDMFDNFRYMLQTYFLDYTKKIYPQIKTF